MQDAGIKETLERSVKAVTLRPSVGQGTAVTTATLGEGLTANVTEGDFAFKVGISEKYGGDNADPNPGTYVRGALAGCIAIGAKMWAARMSIPITALEVEVRADYDVRGELGVAPEVPPGYLGVRYTIRATSPAPETRVREMLETVIRTSSLVDDLARAVPVTSALEIITR